MTSAQPPALKLRLAPLRRFQPDKVIPKSGDNRTAMFVLALALAFNDLKGLLLFREAILPAKPANEKEVAAEPGEWAGVTLQMHRLLVGHLHELLILIKTFEDVARGNTIRSIVKRAPPRTQRDWNDLVNIATGTGTARDATFSKVLVRTRNNAVYHYYQPKMLVAGYRRHFFESPKNPANEYAFASFGTNMERTRFFYADAAVEGALLELVGTMGSKKFNKHLLRAIEEVNHALQHVVSQYLEPPKPA